MFKKIGTRPGRTLSQSLNFEGMGLMSGATGSIVIHPRKEAGFSIRRSHEKATAFNESNVIDAAGRMTQIGWGSDRVMLVEHLLSALHGMGFDSAEFEVTGPEIPIFDGSARIFAESLADVEKARADDISIYELTQTFKYESGASVYLLTPMKGGCKWECVVDYTAFPVIGLQRFDFEAAKTDYLAEVASARTFCLEHEAEMMKAKGLIRGATLDNGVVFGASGPLNPAGLRYENEPARHKLLDLLGDLAPLGVELHFEGVAIKPGHQANNSLAKIIREQLV